MNGGPNILDFEVFGNVKSKLVYHHKQTFGMHRSY